jgi:uncharacterized membrane protein YedE/YeeE
MLLNKSDRYWIPYVAVSLFLFVLVLVVALYTRLWVLTAIPIGFLFGFFLQKGNLCGSSAFSEVLLFKDWKKVWGLWICIVTSMVGFAVLDLVGWVTLNPKPLIWGNYVIGGLVFGIGMVLAGGCVSGCLFKAGTGNLNSIVAILGIALGISMVEHGPLFSVYDSLKSLVIKAPDGGAVTIASLTGLPFWVIAFIFVVLTLACTLIYKPKATTSKDPFSIKNKITAKSWRPWQAGILIGLLASVAYLSSAASGRNYPLGVTHGVMHTQLLITDNNLNHVYQKMPVKKGVTVQAAKESKAQAISPNTSSATPQSKKVSWWLIALVTSLVLGSWVSGRLSADARLLAKPPKQVMIALFGGFLVGIGAALAKGCVIGNILSGWALLSVGTILFGVVVVLANWLTTYFYAMSGTIGELVFWSRRHHSNDATN